MKDVIVSVRFQPIGKVYYFNATGVSDLIPGDFAIVKTSRGIQLGQIMAMVDDPPAAKRGSYKRIERKATPQDLIIRKNWEIKELQALINCRAALADKKIRGVKIVRAEFSFDGNTLTYLYNTEDEDEVDMGSIRKDLLVEYSDSKIDFRRIGPRDVAKLIGGMGACGMAVRCCSTFLTEFSPISIKMAKAQGVSLDPSEITGMCGRLRCCLVYEYEQYVVARKKLPKRGKRVVTPMGEGKVLDVYPMKDSVLVRLDEESKRQEFPKDEIEPWNELEALRRKAEAPCDIHDEGGCNCGRDKNGKADKQKDK